MPIAVSYDATRQLRRVGVGGVYWALEHAMESLHTRRYLQDSQGCTVLLVL